MALTYSEYLRVDHDALLSKGVYDGSLDLDSRLHVDPLLLKKCEIEEFNGAYDDFIHYFDRFIDLVPLVRSRQTSDRAFNAIYKNFHFKERANTGLGYSIHGTHGRGISGALSLQLANTAVDIINMGFTNPKVFALLPLFEDNIGADRISDMTIAILFGRFAQYTQRVSAQLNIQVKDFRYNGDVLGLPVFNKRPIIFVPMSILTDLPRALDYDDIDRVCDYNERLKHRLAELIGLNWQEYQSFHKPQVKQVLFENPALLNEILLRYNKFEGVSYDFEADEKNKYLQFRLQNMVNRQPLNLLQYIQPNASQSVYNVTRAILDQFKKLVEDNYMWRIFNRKGRTPDETDWQYYLLTVADTYIKASSVDIDVNRESNPGAGALDFKFSRGVQGKTVVEIKRSSHQDLLHGYVTQLPTYMRAERAEYGIFLVIRETEQYDDAIQKVFERKRQMEADGGNNVPDIIVVDAAPKKTASEL